MDSRWNQDSRDRYDAHARRLWREMEQRVWHEVRVFNGLEPAAPSQDADELDPLTEWELDEIGDLGELDGMDPSPTAASIWRLLGHALRVRA